MAESSFSFQKTVCDLLPHTINCHKEREAQMGTMATKYLDKSDMIEFIVPDENHY